MHQLLDSDDIEAQNLCQDQSKRRRIVHDESTAPMKHEIDRTNEWFQQENDLWVKVMPYWSRKSAGFAMWNPDNNKWKQAPKFAIVHVGTQSACFW